MEKKKHFLREHLQSVRAREKVTDVPAETRAGGELVSVGVLRCVYCVFGAVVLTRKVFAFGGQLKQITYK